MIAGKNGEKSDYAIVSPMVLKGFEDTLPEDAIAINRFIEKIRNVLERFGFLPIDTPALEYLTILLGTAGEDTTKQIFRLKSPESEDIALRFDLTVPFARFVSQRLEALQLPFRRYHIGPVWRIDKPGPGRFRQFTQLDFDATDSSDMALDAEILCFVCEVMRAVDISDYLVLFNHRMTVDALLEGCKLINTDAHKHVLRVIDKLEKIGLDEVCKELGEGRIDESGDKIKGVGLNTDTIDLILKFLNVSGNTREEVMEGISLMLLPSEITAKAIGEVQNLLKALDSFQIEEKYVKFTPSLTRGLDYYTGPVFEAILPGARQYGSVIAGGRYDGLVRRFLEKDIPATGGSIGISRFISALKAIGTLIPIKSTTKVLITVMEQKYMPHYISIALDLRREGINTEIYFGNSAVGLKMQLSWANKRNIPIAIIVGEDEIRDGNVSIKNMHAGMQFRKDIDNRDEYISRGRMGQITVSRDECVNKIKEILF